MKTEAVLFKPIAHIHCGYKEKFGIPRQSGLVSAVEGRIIFLPEYRNPDAIRGLEGYSHLWLLWQFSEAVRDSWSPTVRPPRLGGNTRMGVFATRSPFRPNPIGLSSVKLSSIDASTPQGPVITVSGCDMLDGTPIYDIKPYLAYTDSHPDALSGFAATRDMPRVKVEFSDSISDRLAESLRDAITAILAEDPRPGYQNDPGRIYTFKFDSYEISFKANADIITVTDIK